MQVVGADQNYDWNTSIASALDWWREAGVDVLVGDEPRDWLAAITAPETSVAPSASLAAEIGAFLAWRSGDDAPEHAMGGTRLTATGPVDADLMVLVDCPERDDRDVLMGGEVGRLFDRMLAAIGRNRADVHLASVCAVRPTAGRLPGEMVERLGEIARHHVELIGAKRLLVMGNAASRAILAADVAPARGRLHSLNHKDGKKTEVVATFHPRFLMERPAAKAEAWRDLQMLIGEMK